MKKPSKKNILIVLSFILGFSILINISSYYPQGINNGYIKKDNNHSLKRAGFWNIGPFEIDDDNPSNNWVITAATYDWCSGSGTINDPYIIDGVSINANGNGRCLTIENSNAYFKISNSKFYNSGSGEWDSGVFLNHTYNGILEHNNITNNNGNGILLLVSEYNLITENNISDNGRYGVYLYGSDNNYLGKNSIKKSDYGIYVYDSDYGITVYNTIEENNFGLYLNEFCSWHNFSFNTFLSNTWNGIISDGIYSNFFCANTIIGSDIGIFLNTFNNSFISNIISGCGTSAIDDSGINAQNEWYGNYYSEYGGVDADDNGIGDTPYIIPGTAGSIDNYPIWDDGDDLSPNIIINSPTMNDAFGLTAPDYDITINDASPINTTWYTIDGGTTNYTFSGLTGTVNQTAWDSKGTEIMTLRFYANDSLGHVGFNEVTIWKDVDAPQITINNPTPNELCGIDAPGFTLTIIEPNILTKRYSLNGRPNITFTSQTQFDQAEWDNMGNGTVSITFYIIDKAGNTNSSEVTVRKDVLITKSIPSQPIPGYHLFFLLGILTIAVLIVSKRTSQKRVPKAFKETFLH